MKSIARARVSIELLSFVYRADRGQEAIEKMAAIQQIQLNIIPPSDGMTFDGFLDLCRETLNVYEGETK